MAIVALAGPATNLAISLVAAILLRILFFADPGLALRIINPGGFSGLYGSLSISAAYILFYTFFLSVILAVFNLIPIPPLDGGRIAVGLLPESIARAYAKIEPFGMILIVVILILDPFNIFRIVLSIVTGIISSLLLGGNIMAVMMTTLR